MANLMNFRNGLNCPCKVKCMMIFATRKKNFKMEEKICVSIVFKIKFFQI